MTATQNRSGGLHCYRALLLFLSFLVLSPQLASAGTQIYSTPGAYTFTVPSYGALTAEAWGGGGGGGMGGGLYVGGVWYSFGSTAGGGSNSSFGSVVGGGGGGGGLGYIYMTCGGSCYDVSSPGGGGGGGGASGGDANSGGASGGGGTGSGGGGGGVITGTTGYQAGFGGGGGAGVYASNGYSDGGGGGGGGGYSRKTYAAGALATGSTVTVVVGSGGGGGQANSCYGPCIRSGYAGGGGSSGAVVITWTAPANCTFNGNTVISGSSVTAYQASSVPYGSSCASQSRTCNNGSLSGTYSYSACAVSPKPSCSVSFSPATINRGASGTLSYTSANASWMYIANVGYMSPNTVGSFTITPTVTTDYTCTVADSVNQYAYPASLTVNQPPICTLAVSPSSITRGGSASLSYTSQNATSFSVAPTVGALTPNISSAVSVSPTVSTTYAGTASGPAGTASCTAPVGNTATLAVSCSVSNVCSGNTIISTDASCNVTNTTCTSPAFCSNGSSICLYPTPAPVPFATYTGDLSVRPSFVAKGAISHAFWDIANTQSCSVVGSNGDSWTTAFSGNYGATTSAIVEPTTYTLSCVPLNPLFVTPFVETGVVNIAPAYREF